MRTTGARGRWLRAGLWLLPPLVLVCAPATAVAPAAADGPGGGTQTWAARDGGRHDAYDQVGGMVTSPDGSTVYLAVTTDGAFGVVARDAATGERRWAVRTGSPGGSQAFAEAVAVSPDGTRVFVTGDVEETTETRSALTVAYDTTGGSILWSSRVPVNDGHALIPRAVVVSPDGTRVFVTGSRTGRHGPDDFWDYFTVGYSALTGDRTWGATYAGPAGGGDTAEGIGVSPDGALVFVTGTSWAGSGSDRDLATVAYAAADGARRWVARYEPEADDFATGLVVSPDGSRLYVAGFGRPSLAMPHGLRIVAYDAATGTRVGVARHDDGNDNYASGVAIAGDGSRAFVTGTTIAPGGDQDFITVGFDTPGPGHRWSATYDGGHGFDQASSVAVSPDGTRVYVTGEGGEGGVACFGEVGSTAYATVEYDAATGARGWVARYAGLTKDPDQARQVAVSPDGSSVFVTGDTDSVCTNSDVGTVAYRA